MLIMTVCNYFRLDLHVENTNPGVLGSVTDSHKTGFLRLIAILSSLIIPYEYACSSFVSLASRLIFNLRYVVSVVLAAYQQSVHYRTMSTSYHDNDVCRACNYKQRSLSYYTSTDMTQGFVIGCKSFIIDYGRCASRHEALL